MTRLHLARLKKLVAPGSWEVAQKAGRVAFAFKFVSNGRPIGKKVGISGCLLGELPAHFPSLWTVPRTSCFPVHKDGISAQIFFGLTTDEYFAMLEPNTKYNRAGHAGTATRERVAARIRTFIRKKEASMPGRTRGSQT